MSANKDGGPAFPFPSGPEPRVNEFHDRCEGMSLRDWFAGMALQGFAANTDLYRVIAHQAGEHVTAADIARCSFVWADAMLAEREKGGAK